MSETVEVCPWTISVSRPMSDGLVQEEPFISVSVCNVEKGQMVTLRCAPDRIEQLVEPIMAHVARIERASLAYCYLAWDKSADELKAAMQAAGASFAPGYGVDVPVIVSQT